MKPSDAKEINKSGDEHSGQSSKSLQQGRGLTGISHTDISSMSPSMQAFAEAGRSVGEDLKAKLKGDSSSSTKVDITSVVESLVYSEIRHQELPKFNKDEFDMAMAYLNSPEGSSLKEANPHLAAAALNAYYNDSHSEGWPRIRSSDVARPEYRETDRKRKEMLENTQICSDDDLRNIKASHIRFVLRFNNDISDDLRSSLKSIAMKQDTEKDYQSEWRSLEKKVKDNKEAREVMQKIIEQMRSSKGT